MFVGHGDGLISACRCIPLTLAKLRKARSVKFIRVRVNSFISMSGIGRDRDERSRGNSHTIGKCERALCATIHGDWEEAESESISRT